VLLFFSNFFLDFDGFSHISALEQNFNPNPSDATRKRKRGMTSSRLAIPYHDPFFMFTLSSGYPKILSSTMNPLSKIAPLQKDCYFPAPVIDAPYADPTVVNRYNLTFPYYPFRTLSPRDMHLTRQAGTPFETSSPLFPAHTQLNLTFKRRHKKDLLDFMVAEKLSVTMGASTGRMTEAERQAALAFGGPRAIPLVPHTVVGVTVKLADIYLMV
jgi:hypothetical protein